MRDIGLTHEEIYQRLRSIVESFDMHIKDRTKGLDYRKVIPREDGAVNDPQLLAEMWQKGGAETLAAWEQAKALLVDKFPFLENEAKTPPSHYSAVEIRRHFANATGRARWNNERIKIFRRGEFIAAIVPPRDLEWLKQDGPAGFFLRSMRVPSIQKARANLSELLNGIELHRAVLEVYKARKLYVGLIPLSDFELLPITTLQ